MKKGDRPENIGVSNPYALAEIKLRKKIAWNQISDPHQLLTNTLGKSYEQLFDPIHDSPLYEGVKYNPKVGEIQRVEILPKKRLERSELPAATRIELGEAPEVTDFDMKKFLDILPPLLAYDVWVDPGNFFEEGAEVTDPIQGGVANCYYIAALSSVAWARTYILAQRTRSTDSQGNFMDMIPFYKAGKEEKIEVTELLPMTGFGIVYKYARSNDPGEIWPGIYEKAYAKWITNDTGDKPDILATAYGDPVGACAELTGLTPYYFSTPGKTAGEIWSDVRSNSISYKTFNPLVAWTYPSGDKSPDKVVYSDANLVANHAYSIIGWAYVNNQKYIVLRNPWGTKEATLNIAGGTWMAWDAPYYGGPGFWRPINMATPDGIFSLRADTFKKYFAGYGWVK